MKKTLRATVAPLTLVISEDIYRTIVRHGYDGIDPHALRTSFFQSVSPKCKFRRSNIIGANLTRADLTECSFDGARVINSTFSQSILDNSTFRGIRIRGGDYHKVNPEMLRAMGIVKLCNSWLSGENLVMQLFW